MIAHTENDILEKMTNAGFILEDPRQDIRNRKVIDRHGEPIGHISDLFVDKQERKVRMLEISAGGFLGLGDRHFIVPVDAVTSVSSSEVHIDQTREKVINSPVYDPKLRDEPAPWQYSGYYGYYGLAPYWDAQYEYPTYPVL